MKTSEETFRDKNVAVCAYGVEGHSAADYALKYGANVTVCDQDNSIKVDKKFRSRLGIDAFENLDQFDLVIRTPGIHPRKLTSAKQIITATQFILGRFRNQTIGITGTKGKGTTSTIIEHILISLGYKVYLGGNIGTATFDFIDDITPEDIVVLELSSFQLMDVKTSPHLATLLRVGSDHLDWHKDQDEYEQAKANISKFQSGDDYLIYFEENAGKRAVKQAPSRKIVYPNKNHAWHDDRGVHWGEDLFIETAQIGLVGPHNRENICAALEVVNALLLDKNRSIVEKATHNQIKSALKEFKGLPHRLEFIALVEGVKYFNDSYAANFMATLAAIHSTTDPKILIVGGKDKGTDPTGLIKEIANRSNNVDFVILIGEVADELAQMLTDNGFPDFEVVRGDMSNIVRAAKNRTKPGQTVIMSPGFASFDMFKNYKDRGEQFKKVVELL